MLEEQQAYAMKQGEWFCTLEQFANAFKGLIPSERLATTQSSLTAANDLLTDWDCSIRFMTEEQWNSRNPSLKKEGETFLTFFTKGQNRMGYRMHNLTPDGTVSVRGTTKVFWQCNVKEWDTIKNLVMEMVLLTRATPEWHESVINRFSMINGFSTGVEFCHLSPFDNYFAAKYDAKMPDEALGKDYQGKYLTNLLMMSQDDIAVRLLQLRDELKLTTS